MEKLPISVLIPTMNRLQTLERTLQSYLNKKYIPSQIVVIDQSKDAEVSKEIKKLVIGFREKSEIIYEYQEIPSLTKARNRAIQFAKEEIIICSDDDIDVYEDTLKNIFELMRNSKLALIAGIDDNSAGSITNIGYLLGTKSFKNRKIGHVTWSMLGRYPDVIQGEINTQWAMGYFFVIRKSLMDKWKICWDEKLTGYAYAEDLDFSFGYYKNAKLENLKCVLNEKVRVRHLVSQEYRTPSKKSTYMYVINRAYLSSKHQMGEKSKIAMGWCDFWRVVERWVKKENQKDLIDAIRCKNKHYKEIKEGIFKCLEEETL